MYGSFTIGKGYTASPSAHSTLQRHFTKVQVAAIALAGMAIFPVFFVSSTPIMLLVSAVLGFWWGFLVATIGTAIGMLLAFLVGKQIFHNRLHRCVPLAKLDGCLSIVMLALGPEHNGVEQHAHIMYMSFHA